MTTTGISRRTFLAGAGAVVAVGVTGCGGGGGGGAQEFVAYKLSGGSRRLSNAAKKNNANKLFATPQAALASLAHPGDPSFVVSLPVSRLRWLQLFGGGRQVADLRHL